MKRSLILGSLILSTATACGPAPWKRHEHERRKREAKRREAFLKQTAEHQIGVAETANDLRIEQLRQQIRMMKSATNDASAQRAVMQVTLLKRTLPIPMAEIVSDRLRRRAKNWNTLKTTESEWERAYNGVRDRFPEAFARGLADARRLGRRWGS